MPWSKVGNLSPAPAPPAYSVEPYTRPADWLPLPAVNVGEQKLVGLYAVHPAEGPNFVALSCAGAYTVNWGDGTAPENFAANIQANHQFTYATIPAATDSTRGYRQVVVTVTPQSGQTLTAVNLGKKHPQAGLPTNASTGWLDVCMAGASVSTLLIAHDVDGSSVVYAALLEQFEYKGLSALAALDYLFMNCFSLQSIKGSQFAANVLSLFSFIGNCYSLRSLVDLNFPKVGNGTSLFAGNKALQRVSGLTFATANPASQMFENCTSLVEVTDLGIPAASAATSMFNGCTTLRALSGLSAGTATDFATLFNACTSLRTVSGLVTTSGTSFGSMFAACSSLRTVPSFDTAQGTTFSSMFSNCRALQQAPALNTAKGTNFSSMFANCGALTALPPLNLAAGTNLASFVSNCLSLSSVGVVGLKVSTSFASCRLSSAALDALYGQLGTAASQTLTVTGNYGTTGDTPSIANAKGWTVTGT